MKIVTRSLFLLFLLIPVGLSGQTEWQLVWSDEFNADGLPDTAVWSYDNGFARNEEAQWYQEGNAYCKDGKLIIEARKEEGRRNPWYEAGSNDWRKKREFIEYTSSCITTSGKKEFLYGRFEVRAKIPVSGGDVGREDREEHHSQRRQQHPGQIHVGAAEVAIGGSLLVDGAAEIQVLDDLGRAHVEAIVDDGGELLLVQHAGAVGVHQNGDGVGHADGVGQLNLALAAQAGGHQVLGDVAGHVGGGAVHLGGVLAGEAAAAVGRGGKA